MLKPTWKVNIKRISKWSLSILITAIFITLMGNSSAYADRDKNEHKQEEHRDKSSKYKEKYKEIEKNDEESEENNRYEEEEEEDEESKGYEEEGKPNQAQFQSNPELLNVPAQNQSTNIPFDKEEGIQLKLADLQDSQASLTIQPVFKQGILFVPAKDLLNYLNFQYILYEQSGILELYTDNAHLIVQRDKRIVYVNERKLSLSSSPITQNGTYYLPLEPILDRLGFSTAWNPQQLTLVIKRRG